MELDSSGHSLNVHLSEVVAIVILGMIDQQAKENGVLCMIGVFLFREIGVDSNVHRTVAVLGRDL